MPRKLKAVEPEVAQKADDKALPSTAGSAGEAIDRAIQIFRDARARAGNDETHEKLAREHAWRAVTRAIDRAAALPPTANDLGAYIRARMTLEVELERDQRMQRAMPAGIERTVADCVASVHERVVELRLLGAPGTIAPPPAPGDIVFGMPVNPMIVSSPFGVRIDPITRKKRYHAGVDLSAPFDTQVNAIEEGTVIFSGWQGGFGHHIVVEHGGGVRSHYSHLRRRFVSNGQMLQKGDIIGAVGASGRATGPHLHFAVSNELGRYVDPIEVLEKIWEHAPNKDAQPSVSLDASR